MIELLILLILLDGKFSMYEIKQRIERDFSVFLNISFGSIHPALKRLEARGCVNVNKRLSSGGQRKSSYSITQDGKDYFNTLMLDDLPANPSIADQLVNIKIIALPKMDQNAVSTIKDKIISYYEEKSSIIQRFLSDEYNQPDKNTANYLNYTIQKIQRDVEYIKKLEINK